MWSDIFVGTIRSRIDISVFGIFLMCFHRTEVKTHPCDGKHHKDGQKCIKVVRNRLDKNLEPVSTRNKTRYSCRPRRNRCNNTDRCSGRINQVSQFRTRKFVFVRNRLHHTSYGKAVEVVINKYNQSQYNGQKLCAFTRGDSFFCPFSERRRSPRCIHQIDNCT